MVFQSFNLFPHRTALENVMEGPVYVLGLSRDRAEERARRLLDRVGLSDRLHAMPRQLSGGQQQRVAIARALAMEPQAILFDEPTSALDPRMTAEVLAVMTDLAGDGLTMIVVTHAMQFARRVAHTVHVFGEGRVIESGPPGQIFDDPARGSDPDPALRRPGGVTAGTVKVSVASAACSQSSRKDILGPFLGSPLGLWGAPGNERFRDGAAAGILQVVRVRPA